MTIDHLDKLDVLGLSVDEYVILGSAAAMAHGHPKQKNDDIDLYVVQTAFDRIKPMLVAVQKAGTTMYEDSTGCLDIGNSVDVFKDDLDKAFEMSCVIDGHRFLNIDGLKLFYEHLYNGYKREKHKLILDWLNSL